MMLKRILGLLLALLLAFGCYLAFWPVPIEPVAFAAPAPSPLTGIYAPNQRLETMTRVDLPSGHGPEDVDVDSSGRVYGGLQDGRIVRHDPSSNLWETFADTGGRPLGLHFDAAGNLIVADAFKGLLSLDKTGNISVLSTQEGGLPFRFTDDLDIGPDGTIYFTDASHKFDQHHYKLDALEHRPNGRLLAYDPQQGTTRLLLGDLYFANGVAVSPDGTFLLVNETWKYRVVRYWLQGERAGQHEVWLDNLPGFPDGISSDGAHTFWLALISRRNPLMDGLSDKPALRKVVSRLPGFLQPKPDHYAMILGLDAAGTVVHNLQQPQGKPFAKITSVEAHLGVLYLGSLEEAAYAFIDAP